MLKSFIAIVAILTFWLSWPGDTQVHIRRGKSPNATSPFVSGCRLSGTHLPDGVHRTRSRDWPMTCLRSTLPLTYLDDFLNGESEDDDGESAESYGLCVTPAFCGMIDDIGWQLTPPIAPAAMASPWARVVLRC